jgi:Phosphoesterase family
MGLMDRFIPYTDVESCSPPDTTAANLVLDYYDGNTVTALWNYAQHFAMSDNSYSNTFGPSSPGAVNVTAANTYGAICGPTSAVYGAPACSAAPGTGRDAGHDGGPGTGHAVQRRRPQLRHLLGDAGRAHRRADDPDERSEYR